jgi:hypothetical protein
MADIADIILSKILPAVVSGGGAGISAFVAMVKGLSSRISKIETIMGSLETRSGFAQSLANLEDEVRALRALSETGDTGRWRTVSAYQDDHQYRTTDRRLSDLDARIDRLEGKIREFVSEDELDKIDRRRSEELQVLRTTLAEIRGMLHGLQSALGLKPRGGSL